jgi:polyhydroxyalkanoate synthesis repressor PhaR
MTQARVRGARKAANDVSRGPASPEVDQRVLKKYPNRRLYDTQTSGYITLADVRQMVLDHESFVVRDAKTGDDLTRSILLQIILEAETDGMPMFTTPVLANIIRFYGHTMQGLMGSYLEKNVQAFTDMQARFTEQSGMNAGKAFSPELWSQFMSVQAPMMQGLMTSYLDQSKQLFVQMQEQMHKQTESIESMFPAGFGLGTKR